MKLYLLGLIVVGTSLLTSCAALQSSDRSRLNNPAMDLASDKTPQSTSYLTNLGAIDKSSNSGGCAVCAK